MTENAMTLVDVSPPGSGEPPEELPPLTAAEQDTVRELVRQARASGAALTGPGGLLKQLTKTVLEAALDEEMSEHLGYDKHARPGRNRGNSRNGKRTKTVLTDDAGQVEIEVPRDRDGTFEPVIVHEAAAAAVGRGRGGAVVVRQGVDHRGDQRALRRGVRRVGVQGHRLAGSPTGSSRRCRPGAARPLEAVYAAVFIDAIYGQGPRRAGRQPAVLRRDRGGPGRAPGRPRAVGRRRRRGVGEVLDERADRPEEPRRRGRVLRRLRRPEGPARLRSTRCSRWPSCRPA